MADERGKWISFFSGLNDLRTNQQLFDFTILIGERAFPVHKVIMAANSDYFKQMFLIEMREREENRVTIEGVDPYIMELVIDYCYTQEISLNDENYQVVLSAASRFMMKSLLDIIANYLSTIFSRSNWSHMMEISNRHNLPKLDETIAKFVCKNLESISEPEWADLKANHWAAIWQEKSRSEDLDEDLFKKFLDWVKIDLVNRIPILDNVAEYVRFDQFTAPYLVKLGCSALIHESFSCLQLIHLAKDSVLMKQWHCLNRTRNTASTGETSWTLD